MNPPIFTIDNYLEDDECDHIISLATEIGLVSSHLHTDKARNIIKDKRKEFLKTEFAKFEFVDKNKDGVMNIPDEVFIIDESLLR